MIIVLTASCGQREIVPPVVDESNFKIMLLCLQII